MKQLIEAFKSARKTEIILIIAAAFALLVCAYGKNPHPSASSDEEKRMEHILSQIDGAGRVQVMLSDNSITGCQGAIVVSPGAEKIEVRLKLQQAVHTLTGLELDQIEVAESKR